MRFILHVDLNAFFASCHQAAEPALKGKPVIVAGNPAERRGVVMTASYEARGSGVKAGMTVNEARRRCPAGLFFLPRFSLYLEYSRRFFQILRSFSPLVEPFSIDEGWLDISGLCRHPREAAAAARALRDRVRRELDLPCSVGVSANKLLAKMASEMHKPEGLALLMPEEVPSRLWPLPVQELFGIGRRLRDYLHGLNIRTIGDLAAAPQQLLVKHFGIRGVWLQEAAHGRDDSPVQSAPREIKSVGHSVTLPYDLRTVEEKEDVLLFLSDMVARRLRKGGFLARVVFVTCRDDFFRTVTRSRTLPRPTDEALELYRGAASLLKRAPNSGRPCRLLGVRAAALSARGAGYQVSLEENPRRAGELARTADRLRDLFGEQALVPARLLRGAHVIDERPV